MRKVLPVIIIFFIYSFFAQTAYAIVFLPAVVLIPVAKIVAFVMGGFSLPALGIGTLWSRLFKKSLKMTLMVIIIILLILGGLITIFLKIHNPDRPLF